MPTMSQTISKTKTIVLISLALFSTGSILAGMLYFYSARLDSQPLPSPQGSFLYASRASYNFGNVTVSENAQSPVITLRNNGNLSLTLTAFNISGENSNQFTQTNNCPQTLTPNSFCTLTLSMKPTSTGAKLATLNITTNANAGTKNIKLTGWGVETGGDEGMPEEEKDVDLTFPKPEYGSAKFAPEALVAAGSSANGRFFRATTTYVNMGSDPSGDFTINLYTSLGRRIDGNARLMGTYTQSSLAPGQKASHEFTGHLGQGYAIHAEYWWIVKLDADDKVKEIDETNNTKDQGFAIAR